MTKEEIIHRLQYARHRIDNVTYAPDVLKAIDIAIEAVSNTDADTISRAKAIAEVEKARAYVGHRYNIESMVGRDIFEMLDNVGLGISKLPPANNSGIPNSSDTISRQAAIDAVEFGITYAKAINKETGEVIALFEESNAELKEAANRIKQLPPAQPEQLEQCPIYGGMCAYPSDQCYDCPRHAGAKMEVTT